MKTIKWLVAELPQPLRTLFAILLIGISALTTAVITLDKRNTAEIAKFEATIDNLTTTYQKKIDSLQQVIYQLQEKKSNGEIEALNRLIKQQKEIIDNQNKEREKQEKLKEVNRGIISQNYDKINRIKNTSK